MYEHLGITAIIILALTPLYIPTCNSVTKNYFENLVRALENGLADVTHAACSKTSSSKNASVSKGKGGKGKGGKMGGSSKNGDD